ncbi:CopM family metallochaperone [Salinicola sp. V024]|uniref:CopM family metallochaperone n=1 Tax=Salinicola sp. V024 TaxID=3459609 RepID=UPI004044A775
MTTSKRLMAGIVGFSALAFAASGFAQSGSDSREGHQAHSASSFRSGDAGNAYREAARAMQHDMDLANSGNPDVDFAQGMLAHHQGAVAMAKVELEYGKDLEMRTLARKIIAAQQAEIEQMQAWLKANPASVD